MLNSSEPLPPDVLGKFNLTRDGRHAYLAGAQSVSYYSTLDCVGSTPFCREHCYATKYPQGHMDTEYRLADFRPGVAPDVFSSAKLVTFFGRGTLSAFDGATEELIATLGNWHPEKNFRFYLRELPGKLDCPENCYIHFAVDATTAVSMSEVIAHPSIRVITVIDHPENGGIIRDLSTKMARTFCDGGDCHECLVKCFGKEKTLLVQKLQD